jgi:2,3-bisphosphoglycerate-independent phosphoglycerate mutase
VPFTIYYQGIEADKTEVYDEFDVKKGDFGLLYGSEFIKTFLTQV